MPIYEFACRACGETFEAIVRSGDAPACPACKSADLERLVSLFAVDTPGTRSRGIAAARARHARVDRDRRQAEHEYEHEHEH